MKFKRITQQYYQDIPALIERRVLLVNFISMVTIISEANLVIGHISGKS